MNNIIKLYTMREERKLFINHDSYRFNPNGKFQWLQNFCFWVLGKLNAYKESETVTMTRHDVNLDNVIDAICKNEHMINMVYRKQAKYIIMGFDCFEKFIRSTSMQGIMEFNFPDDYDRQVVVNGVRYEGLYRGLKVILVPYIEGMFCLPKI